MMLLTRVKKNKPKMFQEVSFNFKLLTVREGISLAGLSISVSAV